MSLLMTYSKQVSQLNGRKEQRLQGGVSSPSAERGFLVSNGPFQMEWLRGDSFQGTRLPPQKLSAEELFCL